MKQWTLDEGILVVRALQPIVKTFNYHVALGGGVINKGYSDKDLDLYFLPMGGFNPKQAPTRPEDLLQYLESLWGKRHNISNNYNEDDLVSDNSRKLRALRMAPRLMRGPDGNFHVQVDEAAFFNDIVDNDSKERASDVYKFAVTFRRNGTDRIDCFIF